ncbi:hypothetical protein [Cohnella sp. GCM10027633]|uniref:hypothetical protein n=1 Tax=unclassified Cohnella TaxID=2636738 RepID=UPI00364277D2
MAYSYEELAQAFASTPIDVHGVYRTVLAPDETYGGHVNRPTTKCGLIVCLKGSAEFRFEDDDRYAMEPGKALLGGWRKRLEIRTGDEPFEYCLVHYLPCVAEGAEPASLTDITMLHADLVQSCFSCWTSSLWRLRRRTRWACWRRRRSSSGCSTTPSDPSANTGTWIAMRRSTRRSRISERTSRSRLRWAAWRNGAA